MLEKGVAAVGDIGFRGPETPGRCFTVFEFTGDQPAVFDMVAHVTGFFDNPAFKMHILVLAYYRCIGKGTRLPVEIDHPFLSRQLVGSDINQDIAANLDSAKVHVIHHPVSLNSGDNLGGCNRLCLFRISCFFDCSPWYFFQ